MDLPSLLSPSYVSQCRCCLARGSLRDLNSEYYFNGIREVYSDLFIEVFNLTLSTKSQLTTLICTNCIQRLRDAASFRMMVVSTEKQLLDAISKAGDNDDTVVDVTNEQFDDQTEIKLEICEDDVKSEIDNTDITNRDYESDNNDYISDNQNEEVIDREAQFLARFNNLPPLPTRATLPIICKEYCRHLNLLKDFKILPSSISKLVENYEISQVNKRTRRKQVTEKSAHVINAMTIIENSNVTPFRSKSRQGFPCFCCRYIYETHEELRDHTKTHDKEEFLKILRNNGVECFTVYVDITDLKCTICESNVRNINELKLHLINVHKKKMYTEFTDRIIPFCLKNFSLFDCQHCGSIYETFGAIERHMNVHYRNYVCTVCGSGFITPYRLKVHKKSMHTGGTFTCERCGKIFATGQKHRNHVNTVHKLLKRFKCTKCPERFTEYFTRQKHMVQVHGVPPLKYKCNVCDKSFDRRYSLSRHMKRDHLEERDFQCELCSYSCFTNNELRVHMVKHNGERIFECAVCKKAYARKKTLKEHMRIHNNDRRFVCAVCGQTFVQKCSLKGHIKTHHMEFHL